MISETIAKPNILFRFMGLFGKGHEKTTALESDSAFYGASTMRRAMRGWFANDASADSHVVSDLPSLREKSGDAFRNIPIATSAIRTAVTNILGSGLELQSTIDRDFLKMSDKEAEAWQDNTERKFRLWSESRNCDAARNHTFQELQEIALLSHLVSGDCFGMLPIIKRPGRKPELCIHLIEGHQVSTPDHLIDSDRLVSGIELDKYGGKKACWVSTKHPGFINLDMRKWRRVPFYGKRTGRRNVIHYMKADRPGQHRGFPYLSPVIEKLKQVSRLSESELAAAVITSFLTIVVKSERDGFSPPPFDNDPNADGRVSANQGEVKLGHGNILSLKPGSDITTIAPNRPNSLYEPFFLTMVREIGAAIQQPIEIILKIFENSYSASMAALNMAWKFFLCSRTHQARCFNQPAFEAWLYVQVLTGEIKATGFLDDPEIRQAFCRAIWHGPARSLLDPVKEVVAAQKRVESGFSTRAEETQALTGGDWATKHRQRVREEKLRKGGGLADDEKPKTLQKDMKNDRDQK